MVDHPSCRPRVVSAIELLARARLSLPAQKLLWGLKTKRCSVREACPALEGALGVRVAPGVLAGWVGDGRVDTLVIHFSGSLRRLLQCGYCAMTVHTVGVALGNLLVSRGWGRAAFALSTEPTGHPCVVARLPAAVDVAACVELRRWLRENPISVHLAPLNTVLVTTALSWGAVDPARIWSSNELQAGESLCLLASQY